MKMKFFVRLVCCMCFRFAWSDEKPKDEILDYKFKKDVNGPYNFKFSTSDGHQREETAELLYEGTEFESIFLRGSYQYLGADGKTYTVKYRADDNGFHPEGEHFEVPPFVPWPSKIDLRNSDGELKDSSDTINPSKLISDKTIRFLTTQRPPKFEYRPYGSSTIPSRYLTTPNPFKSPIRSSGRKSKSFKARNPNILRDITDLTQEYIPTSTQKPPNRGDVVGSSTAKTSRFSSIPSITRDYIPTSTAPPKFKGDIEGTVANLKSDKISEPLRKMSKYSEIASDLVSTTPSLFRKQNRKIQMGEIHPTIIYEGKPLNDVPSTAADDSSVLIPQIRRFGSRTKARKIVSNFVTTEYPSIQNQMKFL